MDLSFLPAPVSGCDVLAGAQFTVRSASATSYGLSRRPGVRRSRAISEEEKEDSGYGTAPGTIGTDKEEGGFDGHSCVKGQHKETQLIPESAASESEKPALESRGRTEWRRQNLSSRSKSLDWSAEARSPGRETTADMLSTSRGGGEEDMNKPTGALEERQTGSESARNRVMTPIHTYYSSLVQDKSPVSHLSQTSDRVSRVNSLPSRLRTQFSSRSLDTASSLNASKGQSIMERIEKLYGSAGFGKADGSTTPSNEKGFGGTFPRRFSLGDRNTLTPVQSIRSVAWTPQTPGSEGSGSLGGGRRLSGVLWQGQMQSRYSPESDASWRKGLADVGTRSLDRARSKNTLAAKIRSARAAGGFTATLESNRFAEEEMSASSKNSFGFSEKGALGKENGVNVAKEKTELRSSITDEDVFESSPTLKLLERKKYPASASVKNKISQFEALTQRAQGLATGQVPMPRRAFSVPTQMCRSDDGVKKSGSAKAIGGWRDRLEGIKPTEKGTGAGKKLLMERFLSADTVTLEKRDNGEDEDERKGEDSVDGKTEDFDKYSRLKKTMEIPLNKHQNKNFYIDEMDFAKVSSPEEAKVMETISENKPPALPSDSSLPSSPASGDDDKTPTNTPNQSPALSPSAQPGNTPSFQDTSDATQVDLTDSSLRRRPLASSSYTNLRELVSPNVATAVGHKEKQEPDLDAWVAGLNSAIKGWNHGEDYEDDDDDDSTQRDDDSNYDSDSGESSVTVTSNMSQSGKSFCVSLSDLCNFAGVEYESENDSDEWQLTGRRSASLSSDVSALSCVSVMPSEELDKLLEDVRNLGDNTLQDYDDVQVAVLHKDVGVGLGFSVAGGVDQNKPVTVHRVFHAGVAAQQGSIMEGDQVLSINGTSLEACAHWEVLRVLRRAKCKETGVVVLRRGGASNAYKSGALPSPLGPTQALPLDEGQQMCVRLEKNNRDLGFSLEGGVGSSQGNRPLTVQKIFQGGPVDKVCPGDQLLEIEGVSVMAMRRLEAWTLIRKLPPGPVDVVLSRPLTHPET